MRPRNIIIKNLAEVEAAKAARPAVMKPQKVNGKWHMPKMSARAIARLRKQHLREGREWKWDIPHKIVEKRVPFKGHLRELRYRQKQEEIARCMARMPKLIEDYRKRTAERKRQKKYDGIEGLLRTPREIPGVKSRF
ncbi:ribosomal protein mL59 [Gracilaria domingensis]|nr:ribosomal protein mL59 [Gracilaria domingensis]